MFRGSRHKRIPKASRASEPPTNNRRIRTKSTVREWVETLVFSLMVIIPFTSFVAQATVIPTGSMEPTILPGDHLFLDKLAFPANYPRFLSHRLPARSIQRGDIVAFKSPEDSDLTLIKRVIGLPGETLEVRDHLVYINGEPLDEPYLARDLHAVRPRARADFMDQHFGPVTIPPGAYFMMGDHRDNSRDSRFWGFVPQENLVGKPLFIYWSYDMDPYDPRPKPLWERAQEYGAVAVHFFSRTRWARTGTWPR